MFVIIYVEILGIISIYHTVHSARRPRRVTVWVRLVQVTDGSVPEWGGTAVQYKPIRFTSNTCLNSLNIEHYILKIIIFSCMACLFHIVILARPHSCEMTKESNMCASHGNSTKL